MAIELLLNFLVQEGGSDLHLAANEKPKIRVDGKLREIKSSPILKAEDVKSLCYEVLDERGIKTFEQNLELDFMTVTDSSRFRVNYYYALDTICAAFRVIPQTIPSLDELFAPEIYKNLIKKEKGLILITGPTGSGKSTTLAAMLNEINLTENKHILTIEDPVEFVHKNKKSLFSQRSVGRDTHSFANALKSSLRQDPDVILIGEMRDKETIKSAITAAETGHLVLSTLHTNSAVQTINRILDSFEADEQPQIQAQLSATLIASISQSLVPRVQKGRVAVSEILINSPAISNLIREGKVHQLYSQMQVGQAQSGMQTQTQILLALLKDGIISEDDALRFSTKSDELKKLMG